MIALLSFAHAFDAGAGWAWQDAPIEEPFDVNVDSFATLAPAVEVESAFSDALDTWSIEAEADLYLRYGGTTTVTRQGDGDNGLNTSIYGGSTFFTSLAVATSTTISGEMVDCDIRFYRSNLYGVIDWHVGIAAAPAGRFDLRHTMIHEVGHCVGLSHSDVSGSMMSPTSSSGSGDERRHLTADDIAGIQFLYGAVSPALELDSAALDGTDPGDTTLTVGLRNTGSGTAWLLDVTLAPGAAGAGFLTVLPSEPVYIEAIGAPSPVGQAVAPEVVEVELPVTLGPACVDGVPQPASLELRVEDVNGTISSFPIDFEASCPPPEPEEPLDTDAPVDPDPREDAAAGGCGCSSGPGALGRLAGLGAGLLARRR